MPEPVPRPLGARRGAAATAAATGPATRQEILDRALVRRGLTDHSPLPPRERGVAPTRQTLRRRRRDPIRRLAGDGVLTPVQVEAAEEIVAVLEAIARTVTRSAFDPAAVPGRRRGQRWPITGFLAESVRPMYRRYLAWANTTGRVACGRGRHARPLLSVVVDLLVDGWSYRQVERSLRLRHGAGHAQAMLRFALACYVLVRGRGTASRPMGRTGEPC
ncbi:MAG: hypothetical protein ACE5JZ_04110 [Kiloniellales bacterium]